MTEQHVNSTRQVLVAVMLVAVAAAAFGASFYYFDGAALVDQYAGDLAAIFTSGSGSDDTDGGLPGEAAETPSSETSSTAGDLALPPGMPEEFALRVWQEQIDSQENIERLAGGQVDSVEITDVRERADRAILDVNVGFRDGSSADGALEMVRFDDVWYFARVTGLRAGSTATDTPLPSVDEIDPGVMNTLLEQHAESSATLEEYATGVIRRVEIDEVVKGPGTVRLTLRMEQTHPHTGYGDLVLISTELEGRTTWFLARFTKTADVPL